MKNSPKNKNQNKNNSKYNFYSKNTNSSKKNNRFSKNSFRKQGVNNFNESDKNSAVASDSLATYFPLAKSSWVSWTDIGSLIDIREYPLDGYFKNAIYIQQS